MELKICMLSAFLFTITGAYYEAGFPECPPTWIRNRNSCYKLIQEPSTWFEALEKCSALNARLIEVENEDEVAYITALTKQSSADIWLGGSDLFKRGSFTWQASGKPVTITNWRHGQPDGQDSFGEACIHARDIFKGQWGDTNCKRKLNFLCEKMVAICSCRPFE